MNPFRDLSGEIWITDCAHIAAAQCESRLLSLGAFVLKDAARSLGLERKIVVHCGIASIDTMEQEAAAAGGHLGAGNAPLFSFFKLKLFFSLLFSVSM